MTRLALLRVVTWVVPVALTYALVALRPMTRRLGASLLLGLAWNAWSVLVVNVVAIRFGWWSFSEDLPAFMGVALEPWLGWTLLWGAVAPLAGNGRPHLLILVAFGWVDLLLMPALDPLMTLGRGWLWGELFALSFALLPGLLFFDWTLSERNLKGRAFLQVVCATALLLWLLPSVVLRMSGGWTSLLDVQRLHLAIVVQLLVVPGALGLRAVIEFVQRGGGTPLPYDPPTALVTSGPYSFLSNPMQLSMMLIFIIGAVGLWNAWLLVPAIGTFLYGIGLADWHENIELTERYGDRWTRYRGRVRSWLPRLRPVVADEATLFVAYSCSTCSSIGRWFLKRNPIGLVIAPAEDFEDGALRRITYLPDGGPPSKGVAAIARSLEHLHLGWAIVGWVLAMPGVGWFTQLLADAFGPTPGPVAGRAYDKNACSLS